VGTQKSDWGGENELHSPVMQILNGPLLFSLVFSFFLFLLLTNRWQWLVQPVPAEVRGTPCREARRGWGIEGFWGKAGVSELISLVGHTYVSLSLGGFFWVPKVPSLAQCKRAAGLEEAKPRLFPVHGNKSVQIESVLKETKPMKINRANPTAACKQTPLFKPKTDNTNNPGKAVWRVSNHMTKPIYYSVTSN